MSSINSLRYIRDYLKTKDHTKMIPNVLRPGGAELKPRGSISMAMAKVNKPAALIIGVGAMFVFGMNAASHPGGGSVIEQEVKNIKETPTTWSG